MPPIVSVTLRVPRSKLSPFISKVIKVGCTPPLHGILESSPRSANQWQHMFAATQIGFGILKTKGFRFSNSFELEINEDQVGWSGNSPMFLSFYVPSWILLQEPRIATVSFAIEHSPAAIEAFGGDVERDLNIFTAMQNDVEHVYITKRQPHQSEIMTMCGFTPGDVKNHVDPQGNSETTITATVNENAGVISSFTSRVKILSEQPKALLRDGSGIKRSLRSPFSYALSLRKGPSFIANFPSAVLDSTARVKIARKSSYLELVADVAKPNDWPTLRSSTYPVLFDEKSPVLWNMPRLNLSSLPIIDLSSASSKGPIWLQQLLATMLSERELALNLDSPLAASPSVRAKLEFKNMLVNMFSSFGQSDGRNVQIYTIDCHKERGVQMVFFLSKLVLDVSNRTAVLDAAVLPVHADDLMDVTCALIALSNIGHPPKGLRTSQDVMCLWKEALPAWTERCRTWDHKPSCEYVASEIIPLSVKYGERVLCSCGEGTVPTGFMPNFTPWEDLAKYAVRVAISPAFPSVLVEKPLTELPDLQICQVCAKDKADDGSDLRTCSRCRKTKYCSKECQKADWKEYKKVCKADGN